MLAIFSKERYNDIRSGVRWCNNPQSLPLGEGDRAERGRMRGVTAAKPPKVLSILPPAAVITLIRQKSEIFDTFPQGKALLK